MNKLEAFRIADWEEQSRLLEDEETAREVEAWLGPTAFAELCQLSGSIHHMAGSRMNLIVVPGVMGSVLKSAGLGGIWWLDMLNARDKLNGLALAPDGIDDLDSDAGIEPCAIDISYVQMRKDIAKPGQFGGSKEFYYDWRKPLSASAALLRDLIVKVYSDYDEKVHLVGHSMGGLMIRTALMLHGDELWPKIGKIVFIATPHYGSTSIAGYLKNHLWGWEQLAVLGAYLSRETFRSLWGVLSLLPAPKLVYPGTRNGEARHPCANFELYDAGAYRLDLNAADTEQLQRVLDAARKFHTDLFNWHNNDLSPSQYRRMLQICGVGRKTLFRLEEKNKWPGKWEDINKITKRIPGDPHREGDGRVPLASAELENIKHRYVQGEHGSVQNLPAVVQDVLDWISDRPLSLPDSSTGALRRNMAGGTTSPAPHLDGSAEFSPFDDEYDRYQDLSESRIKELVAEFKSGELKISDQIRIL